MKAQEIYTILRAGGLSRAGALGMIGNMWAESTLKENIAQRGMTKLTDDQYTAAADNGLLDFVNDAVGFGLCQWTFHARKKALLAFAKKSGVSVGNGPMQVRFCLKELTEDFPAVFDTLCSSNNIDECADLVCVRFEMPAVNNYATRRNFAYRAEKECIDEAPKDDKTYPVNPSIGTLQLVMQANGYWGDVTGRYSPTFIKAMRDFADGIELTWEGHK